MNTAGISKSISAAIRHEAHTGSFHRKLQRELPELQKTLLLPGDAPLDALMDFVVDYVGSVPGCLDLVAKQGKRQGFYDYAAPLLQMALSFFLEPPDVLPDDGGLEALLDEAFLAHRLLEEINDHYLCHLQRPLLPVDMTEANLIVHYLLGDAFATALDQLVQYTAAQLLSREYVWEQVKERPESDPSCRAELSGESFSGRAQRVRLRLDGR